MPKPNTSAIDLIRKVYTLAKPYGRRRLALVSGLSLAQGIFQVIGVTSIFPFLALAADPERLRNSQAGQRFLDLLPEMDNERLLLVAGIFAIVMLVLANVINVVSEFVRVRYASNFAHWLRIRLLRRITSRPYTDFLNENSAVLIKKVLGDVLGFTAGVLLPLLDSFARIATIALLIATLFLVQPQIAIGATVGFGLFYLVIFKVFGKWRKSTAAGLKVAQRGSITELKQILGGIKPVKVHRAEEIFIDRFSRHSLRQAQLLSWIGIVGSAPRYFVEPLAFGGVVVVVLTYASRGQDLAVILPNLGVMALAGYRLLPALQLLYSQLNQLGTSRHTLDEVYDEFLAAESSSGRDTGSRNGNFTAPSALPWKNKITLDNLGFCYPGTDRPVIDRLTLEIPKNTSLGIIGTTGSGKSTLVDLILGLHIPTEGRILIDGVPLGPDTRRSWRGGIGYVPQEMFLIDDSIAANIAFGLSKDKIDSAALIRAAEAAQILDFIENELPLKWETIVGENGARLSGGQRQRIGLARALYHEPSLLILDEATSALDLPTEAEVMKAITALQGSMTMLIIAHRLSTIEGCTKRLDLSPQIIGDIGSMRTEQLEV